MAEPKVPLLANSITLPEQIMLAGLTRHVGFPVLVKLFEAICERAMQDVAKVDPEKENYDRILAYRQQRSRVSHEVTRDVLDSIEWHKQMAGKAAQAEELLDGQLQLQEN